MEIDKKMLGAFFSTEVGGDEMTDAVNAIQRAYDEYMKPAWEKVEKEGAAGGEMVAERGFSFMVAVGAFHMVLSGGTNPQIESAIADAVGDVVTQMRAQLAQKYREQNNIAKA